MQLPVFGVSQLVALVNAALEAALPAVAVTGELSNFRVSKNRWVYFDLKDEAASVRCFGTVYMLPGPLEDGMVLEVQGVPRLHPLYGFSLNAASLRPVGEGSLRQAARLLQAKLAAEGLFEAGRKRQLPYPPQRVGLITSAESAAYADFIKVLGARWSGLTVELADVQVQGEAAPGQLMAAINWFNGLAGPPDVLVLVRGGGSPDDLAAFSDERVVRAVAASRIPTMVAIGHEVDVSLAELAADQRASTPSNAAELLVPDRREVLAQLQALRSRLADGWYGRLDDARQELADVTSDVRQTVLRLLEQERTAVAGRRQLAEALNPAAALARGFAVVRGQDGRAIRHTAGLAPGAIVRIETAEAGIDARVEAVHRPRWRRTR